MGSGDRIKAGLIPGLGLCLTVARFPFALTVNVTLACFWLSIGFGKGYDQ